ncbi:MAG TPA: sigma-54 dependent transcriptional regulator [Anaeromyxobacteraceae bacterium]|nr:sigma-54 dependent transcriptional regulator [Anaeromyxobacteraceae bacterium]
MDTECTVLVIDDDEAARGALCEYLGLAGYRTRVASSGAEAIEALQSPGPIGAVLLDLVMPGLDGFEVLRRYREQGGAAPVVVLSALSDAEDVVKAMKFGATDYLPKPFDVNELDLVLRRALEGRAGAVRQAAAGSAVAPSDADGGLGHVSVSAAMYRVWELVRRVADTDVPVLLVGESGVGKDVVARRIHAASHRASHTFVKINCAALPAELLESELFGHEKGAFTGAHAEKPGKFELAHQGTIFLDEIGDMDPRLQAKLLQVLQDEEYYRVGGKRPIRVDARVVVATNRDLEAAIEAGAFREDLFYRLNVVTIRVPPLRERKEDVAPLVRHFVEKYRRRYQGGLQEVPPEVMERFQSHDWPGNVRELENLVRRLVVLRDPAMVLGELGPAPTPIATPPQPEQDGARREARPALEEVPLKEVGRRAARLAEREAILRALMRTGWNKRRAAQRLQISYKALLYKIKDCEIVDPRAAASLEQDRLDQLS